MNNNDSWERLEKLVSQDTRYPLRAYVFVLDALTYTVNRKEVKGNITGGELLDGILDLALDRFGPMARTVFDCWSIHKTRDFGEIVFNLVKTELLGATESDSIEDFDNKFDFKEFDKKLKWELPSEEILKFTNL